MVGGVGKEKNREFIINHSIFLSILSMFSKLRVVLIVFRAMLLDPYDYRLLSLAFEAVRFLYDLFIFTCTNLSSSD